MDNTKNTSAERKISASERNFPRVPVNPVSQLIPGLLLVTALAWFSVWLSEFIGVDLYSVPFVTTCIAVTLPLHAFTMRNRVNDSTERLSAIRAIHHSPSFHIWAIWRLDFSAANSNARSSFAGSSPVHHDALQTTQVRHDPVMIRGESLGTSIQPTGCSSC